MCISSVVRAIPRVPTKGDEMENILSNPFPVITMAVVGEGEDEKPYPILVNCHQNRDWKLMNFGRMVILIYQEDVYVSICAPAWDENATVAVLVTCNSPTVTKLDPGMDLIQQFWPKTPDWCEDDKFMFYGWVAKRYQNLVWSALHRYFPDRWFH